VDGEGASVGQALVTFGDIQLLVLFQISFGVMVAATLVALALPGGACTPVRVPHIHFAYAGASACVP
jgi:hypothetical protein